MSRVIVTHGDQANTWAQQFCRRAAWTRQLAASEPRATVIIQHVTRASIVTAMAEAARRAGGRGEVIYAIGHGNGDAAGANVQLGVDHDFTVTHRILSADAEGWIPVLSEHAIGRVPISQDEQLINTAFRQIGQSLARARVRRLTFLNCVLGNNESFLRSLKNALGGALEVAGYKGYVATIASPNQPSNHGRVQLFVARDPGGTQIMGSSATEPFCLLETPAAEFVTVV